MPFPIAAQSSGDSDSGNCNGPNEMAMRNITALGR
ncbi:hypothetical protein PI125_g18325 [Phytophthora idaei]|nr:hypothetical protein PI125_g18325 [Phytophthora idaei]